MNASDIMTRSVLTVPPNAPIADALRMMLNQRISGLPVIDDKGSLVGVLTEGDLLRREELGTGKHRSGWLEFLSGAGAQAENYVRSHARRVDEIMTTNVVTAPETASLAEIVALMEDHRVRRVPIVTDGKLVGVVSRADFLRVLLKQLDALSPVASDDASIRKQLLADLESKPWTRGNRVDTIVADGVVFLEGLVFDDRDRKAIRVAAENVPGVKAVLDHIEFVDPRFAMAYGIG